MSAEKTPQQRWLPVVQWEGLYEVSDRGQVRSVARSVERCDGRARWAPSVLLKQQTKPTGHMVVSLKAGDRKITRTVHRLMADAFHGLRPEGLEVRHLDGNPRNNVIGNLRYGTHQENAVDVVDHGTHYQTLKTRCPLSHDLRAPNLVASELPKRACLACNRARALNRNRASRRKPTYEFATLAHAYSLLIMSGESSQLRVLGINPRRRHSIGQ